ncbi:MAG: hypothetical protein ACREKH_19230 [Candidatus Rokuibacteriota bacterium]
MIRSGLAVLVLVMALAVGTPALAVVGALDNVPAATLLLPFFQVDLNDPDGVTTLLSINNASATAILAHVTFWSDLSVPTLAFNVYLTGFDVYTLNLRDVFTSGVVPATASDGQDPKDTISPQGDFSQDINFASCNGQLPLPPLDPVQLAHVRAAHTGQASPIFGGLCTGVDFADNVARGYITIDTVNNCTLRVPGDVGYFEADVTFQNVLWGDYFYVDPGNNFAQGENFAHLEASPTTLGAANYTFYRRYTTVDFREGLASTWGTRFLNGGPFDGGTTVAVWRDSKRTIIPFSCALVAPAPFPLGHTQIVAFDEQENPDVTADPSIFPWEANLIQVGGPDLPVPFDFGWLYLNLNTTVLGSQVPFEPVTQNHVTVVHSAEGRFSVGHRVLMFDNVTTPGAATNVVIGP